MPLIQSLQAVERIQAADYVADRLADPVSSVESERERIEDIWRMNRKCMENVRMV